MAYVKRPVVLNVRIDDRRQDVIGKITRRPRSDQHRRSELSAVIVVARGIVNFRKPEVRVKRRIVLYRAKADKRRCTAGNGKNDLRVGVVARRRTYCTENIAYPDKVVGAETWGNV